MKKGKNDLNKKVLNVTKLALKVKTTINHMKRWKLYLYGSLAFLAVTLVFAVTNQNNIITHQPKPETCDVNSNTSENTMGAVNATGDVKAAINFQLSSPNSSAVSTSKIQSWFKSHSVPNLGNAWLNNMSSSEAQTFIDMANKNKVNVVAFVGATSSEGASLAKYNFINHYGDGQSSLEAGLTRDMKYMSDTSKNVVGSGGVGFGGGQSVDKFNSPKLSKGTLGYYAYQATGATWSYFNKKNSNDGGTFVMGENYFKTVAAALSFFQQGSAVGDASAAASDDEANATTNSGCNVEVSADSQDGTGKVKQSDGFIHSWKKTEVPSDIAQYTHNINNAKMDWSHTTPDAYNQCAGFSQVYMNAIWSPNFTFRGNGNQCANAVASQTGVKVTRTPKAGAIFSSDRPNHTGVVLHVLANGDLIIANQNATKSGQNAGTTKDYEISLIPKKEYQQSSNAIGYGDMTFAYPGDNSKYKIHW